MVTQVSRRTDVAEPPPQPPAPDRSVWRGVAWALLGLGVFLFVFAAAHNMRSGGDLTDRVRNPAVHGHPRPVRPLFGDTAWMTKLQVGHARHADARRHPLRRHVATAPQASGPVDGDRVHRDRVDGPDHELGAVRGLQPVALALAGVVAAGFAVADRRAARRVRLRDVLSVAVLPRDVHPAPPATAATGRLVRLAPSARHHGRCSSSRSGSCSTRSSRSSRFAPGCTSIRRSFRSARSSPGKPYQFPLIWESALVTLVMIPAGVLLYRDDTGKTRGREARAARAMAHLPRSSGARDVLRHVRDLDGRVHRLRAGLRRDPLVGRGDVGRVSVARIPTRRCTTRRATTPRPGSPVRTSRVAGTVGSRCIPAGRTRRPRAAARCSPKR